jgi:hypothetical protein
MEKHVSNDNELKGLGGWLILVGIGVVIAPIRQLLAFIQIYEPLFEDGIWTTLTSVDSEAYNPLWAPLLIGEIAYNCFMVVVFFYLVYLFFSKHYLFPRVYIAVSFIALFFIPLYAWQVSNLLPSEPMIDSETAKTLMSVLARCLIWVPYMLFSKRVKLTFVNKMPDKNIKTAADITT